MPRTAIRSSALMADEGIARACARRCRRSSRRPARHARRAREALYGAWLCGTVLGAVGMALHHKLCHTLGGSFDLPHAETHAIMLPHTIGFNAAAVPDAARAGRRGIFGGTTGARPLRFRQVARRADWRCATSACARADLDRAAEIALANPYWNPRPIDRPSIRALLQAAWEGDGAGLKR